MKEHKRIPSRCSEFEGKNVKIDMFLNGTRWISYSIQKFIRVWRLNHE